MREVSSVQQNNIAESGSQWIAMDSPQHEAHETTDHSNLTKIRLAVRREKKTAFIAKW